MKRNWLIRAALTAPLLFAGGCAQNGRGDYTVAENPAERGFDIDMNTTILLRSHFQFMPSISGYDLPEGLYRPLKQDDGGIWFLAVNPARALSLADATPTKGGIYLPKRGSSDHPSAFVEVPVMGMAPYYLPREFLEQQGTLWVIQRGSKQ